MSNKAMRIAAQGLAMTALVACRLIGIVWLSDRSQKAATVDSGRAPDLSRGAQSPDEMFRILRVVLDNDPLENWALSPGLIGWSTLTVNCGERLTLDAISTTMHKWNEPRAAFVHVAYSDLTENVTQAVQRAIETGKGEIEFSSGGIKFYVNARNGGDSDTTFVRISFMGSRYRVWSRLVK